MQESDFICPLSLQYFNSPVLADDGKFYEKAFIQEWLEKHDTSPLTRQKISNKLIVSEEFNEMLKEFYNENPELESDKFSCTNYILEDLKCYNYTELLRYSNFDFKVLFRKKLMSKLMECPYPKIIAHVLRNSVNRDQKDIRGRNILYYACRYSNIEVFKTIVNFKINLYHVDYSKKSIIHYACIYSKLDIMKYLVEIGYNLQATDTFGRNGLHYACKYGNYKIINYLVDKIDTELKDIFENKPINYAETFPVKFAFFKFNVKKFIKTKSKKLLCGLVE